MREKCLLSIILKTFAAPKVQKTFRAYLQCDLQAVGVSTGLGRETFNDKLN